jgi:phage protein U
VQLSTFFSAINVDNSMLMALGNFIFELRTVAFGTMQKTYEYRWASTEVVGNPPVLQALGKGADKVDLEGVVYPQAAFGRVFTDPIGELREIAETQEPALMVDGSGGIHGLWAIKQISETQSYFDKFGKPKKVEFSTSLERYDAENYRLSDILSKIL